MDKLSIKQFLDEIDPQKTIDRKQAQMDITLVVLLKAIAKAKDKVAQETKDKLDQEFKDTGEFDFDKIYNIFTKNNEQFTLLQGIADSVPEVQADYMKTHLEALPANKRIELLQKYPYFSVLLK